MGSKTIVCSNCGARSTDRFCSECGTPLKQAPCPQCGSPIEAGAQFCAQCGHVVGAGTRKATPTNTTTVLAWAAAGTVVVALLVIAIAFSGPSAPAGQPPGGAAGAAGPPGAAGGLPAVDFANMTPRQRADQFFDHLMRADERGDTAEVMVFRPLALQAYAELGSLDNDARFHVGMIEAISGGSDAALAQADSLDLAVSGHLLASNIRHAVAKTRGDVVAMRRAYQAFLDNYDREVAAARPEYAAHQRFLESFRTEAQQGLSDTKD